MTTPLPTRAEEEEYVDSTAPIFLTMLKNDNDITDEWYAFGVDDSTGEEVEVILLAIHDHRVSCIVAPLESREHCIMWYSILWMFLMTI